MADAGIAIWESKYYYDIWRPITGIASPTSAPARRAGDGNPARRDPTWSPLGHRPVTHWANFTPPFPAYPSGHAGSGALSPTLRRFYETDDVAFTFVSDELTESLGTTKVPPPLLRAASQSLSQAEEENARAESTSASTGPSTKRRASPWADSGRLRVRQRVRAAASQ